MSAAEKPVIDYQAAEMARLQEMQRAMTERLAQVKSEETYGSKDLRRMVLSAVVDSNYETAREKLDSYVESRSQYPNFQSRVERLRKHCADLISAVETKRTFYGLGSLPLSKQQELYEKVINHFEELKSILKSIERIDNQVRLDDIRSTTWLLKAIIVATFVIVGVSLMLDLNDSLLSSMRIVFGSIVADVANMFFRFLGI